MRLALAATAAFAAATLITPAAQAFCGFYVAGADAPLANDATMTVLMRDGTRTVLSMRPRYAGPPRDFAMVVPVPVVLQESNVKILSAAVFDRLDTLTAPRLVEYWEQDPCPEEHDSREGGSGTRAKGEEGSLGSRHTFGVVGVIVEAEFQVGEYEIVILSASDSTGLEQWLRDHDYRIPDGAEPLLRPYVTAGSKFFVAKVDVSKVVLGPRGALLSPLRVHYDEDAFRLPIRLGLLNSSGTQDLVVMVLAKQRYELANYENLFAPTNVDVADKARARFGELYAAVFDRTVAGRPVAAVTEYAWDSSGCDPCPTPPVTEEELRVLGADVVPAMKSSGVLTRLHMRYGRDVVGEDLVFKTAPAIAGGDESRPDDQRPRAAQTNAFQARYVIRHRWRGAVDCSSPSFGVWGGPPDDRARGLVAAKDVATARRGAIDLAKMIGSSRALGIEAATSRFGAAFARGAALGAALACIALLGIWRWMAGALRSARAG